MTGYTLGRVLTPSISGDRSTTRGKLRVSEGPFLKVETSTKECTRMIRGMDTVGSFGAMGPIMSECGPMV